MKKLKEFYLKISNKLASIKQDKYIHFNACALISAIVVKVIPLPWFGCVPIAITVGTFIGILKEIYDYFDYGVFDWNDIKADVAGSVTGALLGFDYVF